MIFFAGHSPAVKKRIIFGVRITVKLVRHKLRKAVCPQCVCNITAYIFGYIAERAVNPAHRSKFGKAGHSRVVNISEFKHGLFAPAYTIDFKLCFCGYFFAVIGKKTATCNFKQFKAAVNHAALSAFNKQLSVCGIYKKLIVGIRFIRIYVYSVGVFALVYAYLKRRKGYSCKIILKLLRNKPYLRIAIFKICFGHKYIAERHPVFC